MTPCTLKGIYLGTPHAVEGDSVHTILRVINLPYRHKELLSSHIRKQSIHGRICVCTAHLVDFKMAKQVPDIASKLKMVVVVMMLALVVPHKMMYAQYAASRERFAGTGWENSNNRNFEARSRARKNGNRSIQFIWDILLLLLESRFDSNIHRTYVRMYLKHSLGNLITLT